jgi:hypothetical protein
MPMVAADYGVRDGSGIHRVVHLLISFRRRRSARGRCARSCEFTADLPPKRRQAAPTRSKKPHHVSLLSFSPVVEKQFPIGLSVYREGSSEKHLRDIAGMAQVTAT